MASTEVLCANVITAATTLGGGGFQPQGQIDLTSIVYSLLQFGYGILERSAQVGIERLTLDAGYAIGGRLTLGFGAAQRLKHEIRSSHAFSWIWSAVHVCMGTKHVVRRLAESREGLSILPLVGCMSEMYNIYMCAEILEGLFDILRNPCELMPSKDQWIKFVMVCRQAVPSTAFKDMLARMPKSRFQPRHHIIATTAHVSAICEALGYFLRPHAEQATVVCLAGGADCGRIAAVLYWLMDYSIEIYDGMDKPLMTLIGGTRESHWVIATYDKEPLLGPVYFKDLSWTVSDGFCDEFNA
ncbi:hypothetical protein DACRYDRAFT_118347 [Dacryopinax primogenitus]|uniref:Uncharacterized protein n=1 Tax=Dacryopinax primogenitus (strain DJM 731) TaxID=1858805 RepID=M5G5N0_DACPD|nr:uncharacterized protein DACRYDRAFT_118347 [Dacryopinax primogenitus]EJT99067.1 hypothetical protein DACRYDRAFT_118347 [Dacryopinax primogenitus]